MYNPYKRHTVCEPKLWSELVFGTLRLIITALCVFAVIAIIRGDL